MPRAAPRPKNKPRPKPADAGADRAAPAGEPAAVEPIAVIDVGASAIRMAVAEVHPGGEIRELEHLAQSVNLGKDVFGDGAIAPQTIEQCVRVLRDYRSVLAEYRLLPASQGPARRRRRVSPDRLRVVATSAVREATNRLTFLDRVFAATGIEVETIDEAEANRITYLGILPQLSADPALDGARCVVTEVGGGSTELLVIRRGDVLLSQSYRLGALRLRELLGGTAPGTARQIMERQIDRTVGRIAASLPAAEVGSGDPQTAAPARRSPPARCGWSRWGPTSASPPRSCGRTPTRASRSASTRASWPPSPTACSPRARTNWRPGTTSPSPTPKPCGPPC